MSDNSQASVKRKSKKKGDSSPSAGLSSRSKKVRRVDKSSRTKNARAGKASTPLKEKSPSKEITADVKADEKKPAIVKKADPEVLKAIRDGRENFVHTVRRGTKSTNVRWIEAKQATFTFPPGRIYKIGTDPKTVPVVPTTKMKDEMRGMNQRTGRKKSKQRKYLAERTSTASRESTADTRNADKSSASRKKSRNNSKMRGRRKDTPIPPK